MGLTSTIVKSLHLGCDWETNLGCDWEKEVYHGVMQCPIAQGDPTSSDASVPKLCTLQQTNTHITKTSQKT